MKVEFLDQVPVIVDTRDSPKGKPGSLFEMTSYEGDASFREWKREDFTKLRTDLRRMLFPFRSRDDDFQVWLDYEGFSDLGHADGTEEIEPLPIFDFFDYRIKVQITNSGEVSGTFSSPLVPGKPEESLSIQLPPLRGAPCGTVVVDLRVVDREPASLQSVLDRSRAAEDSLSNIGKAQLKRLLNEACGVSVYRGNFRIRPYGDNGNDWLELDRKRVNDPSFNIGNNQIFGTVVIEAEALSHLEEKSARDGLREDDHYNRLSDAVLHIVQELQRRRYEIRRAVGRIAKSTPVALMLSRLTDYEKPFSRISRLLSTEGIGDDKIAEIREILKLDSDDRQETVSQLEQRIAIYQGQATLGKMVGKLLHEGNRSLGILGDQGRRMPNWLKRLINNPDEQVIYEVTNGLNGISSATESLVELFDSIEPLGVRSRKAPREVALVKPIQTIKNAFAGTLEASGINFEVDVPADFKVTAWEQDLNTILLNIVENSIHWLINSKTPTPRINISLEQDNDGAVLNIADNGPGIPLEHIQSEAIFEPTFSLRGGLGLGLPIAGECATRNKFELRAVHSEEGAHFILDFLNKKYPHDT
jgi:signal transduction histidine kinase